MTSATITVLALLTAGVVLSALRYGRIGQLPLSKKILLIMLRTAWIVGLALSFLEPVIRFERFESGRMRIPVLIDASASMRNFSPQSSVLPFLDSLAMLQARTNGRVSFEYYLFGDSTRELSAGQPNDVPAAPLSASIRLDDTKSIFPTVLGDGGARLSSDMIIVTDGHWTRARRSSEIFPRSTIYYYVLPDAVPNPFVTVSADAPETSAGDSVFTVSAEASGYAQEASSLVILLKGKDRVIGNETINVDRGYFTHTVQFRTKSLHPGRRLYTVEASIDSAAPPSVSSFVHQTVPHYLSYSIYSARPTLDRRYLSQALASDDFYKFNPTLPDILFLFDWDSSAAQTLRKLPRHSVAVFLGALPCETSRVTAPPSSIKRSDDAVFGAGLDLRAMPPPEGIAVCKQPPITNSKRMLYASVGNQDNVPILFTGRFRGTQGLFCPVRGIWRWDFWPMSSDRTENELFGFSNMILSTARELLLDNISDQLILYPAAALHETDSAKFLMSLPAAVPIFEPVKLSVQIRGGDIDMDTVMDYRPTGLNRQPLSLPTFPPGKYSISSNLTAQGVKAAFADSFSVNKDMSELSVLSQNTQYLQEFAQPLDGSVSSPLFEAWSQRSAERSTVTETIRIRRSWLLLGLVLILLAVELWLRRQWGVD